MTHEFLDHLEDILENLENAELFVEGLTFEQFNDDTRITGLLSAGLGLPIPGARITYD